MDKRMNILNMKYLAVSALVLMLSACGSIPDPSVTRYQWDDINDSDKDGVVNQRDLCDGSPEGAVIDSLGCAHWQPNLAHKEFSIDFDYDQDTIRPDQQSKMVRLAEAMNKMPSSLLKLIGDTSSEGSLEYNKDLAHRRAESIIDALEAQGIDRSRIEEHVFTDSANSLFRSLQSRRRRTLGLIIYPGSETVEDAWTIYTAEDASDK